MQKSNLCVRLSSALFYGLSSFLITVVNKAVLTIHGFPSFQVLGLGQMGTTVIALFLAKKLGFITFPSLEVGVFRKIWPLPVLYIGNVVLGLGGTKELSLPMFTVLRRFSILMTMLGERFILGEKASFSVQASVFTMIFGAIIAASNDLAFNAEGYTLILLNDLFTAMNGVIMKQKLISSELNKDGLLFYNSMFMIGPGLMLAWILGDIHAVLQYPHWGNPMFLFQFAMSCVMGLALQYSVLLCTFYNSALTTTVIGCLKNITITYLGMLIGGDYIFSWTNFIGINISVAGSLFYSWVTFRPSKPAMSTKNLPVATV